MNIIKHKYGKRTVSLLLAVILVLTTGETATYVLGSIPTLKQEK